jgi:hypothetical protein
MDGTLKITNETSEVTLYELLNGNRIANIPLFQRGYSWGKPQMDDLYADILSLLEDDNNLQSQFMGVIITFQQTRKSFGSPDMLDIVDGQQRLFSCYLLLLAVQQIALDKGQEGFISFLKEFMYINKFPDVDFNTKIMPPARDRWQFSEICHGISTHKNIIPADWGEKLPRPPKPSGEQAGRLTTQYKHILKKLRDTLRDNDNKFEILEKISHCVLEKLGFVVITLKHPASAPVIFERLNSRGVKITTADLVRNEIFSRLSDEPDEAIHIFENFWKPFEAQYAQYGVDLDSLLWPYGLMIDSNIRKADLFNTLRSAWRDKTPQEIIVDLKIHTPAILALKSTYEMDGCPKGIKAYITRFKEANLPSSTYCFVLRAIQAVMDNTAKEHDIVGAFDAIDSLLVRRACCGIEPSGLHAVFKGMWRNITEDGDGVINFVSVKHSIGTRLPWPDDDLFMNWVAQHPQYQRKIAKYFIGQYESHIARETPSQKFELEHIIPQNPDAHWKEIIGDRSVKEVVDRYANLLPITSAMNKAESRKPYAKKRKAFDDSMFASTRALARNYDDWTIDTLEARGKDIADWAVSHWPK